MPNVGTELVAAIDTVLAIADPDSRLHTELAALKHNIQRNTQTDLDIGTKFVAALEKLADLRGIEVGTPNTSSLITIGELARHAVDEVRSEPPF